MSVLSRIKSFITKDVHNENEAKKRTIIMRMFILVTTANFFLLSVITGIAHTPFIPVASSVLFILHCILYYCTYIDQTRLVVLMLQIVSYLWIVSYVLLFGWDCGTQHFLFVLLLLGFLSGYYSGTINVILAMLYCGTRIGLYWYCQYYDPIFPLTHRASSVFQMLNTVTIFAQITLMIYMFSKESIATEKKLVSYNKKIKDLAAKDPLTKLRNRRSMLEFLEDKINTPGIDAAFCIGISDIDFFKKVNDTYGHEAGDEVLRVVSKTISDFMSDCGTVARWGGEEFLLYFDNPNGDEVYCKLKSLRSIIENTTVTYGDTTIPVTMTFGLMEYTAYQPLDYTINHADQKLYLGKKEGRNCVVF